MWWFTAVAIAAEIQVSTPGPMRVEVDGLEVPYGPGGFVATAADLAPGVHEVAVRDDAGRSASIELDLAADRVVRLRFARNQLVLIGSTTVVQLVPAQVGARGSLLVAGVGDASGRVWIDGQSVSYLPKSEGFAGARLAPGMHELRVEDHGRVRFSGAVEVRSDLTRRCVPAMRSGEWELDCHWVEGLVDAPAPDLDDIVTNPLPVEAAVPEPVDERTFQSLRTSVTNAGFSSDRIDLLKTAAVHHWFTMAQLGSLLDLLSFSSDKLDAVEVLRHRVLDPQNAHEIDAHLSFSSDREAVQLLFRDLAK